MDAAALQSLEESLLHEDDLTQLSAEEQFELLTERVANMPDAVTSSADLLKRLKSSRESKKPLHIKFGIDPTGPDIHLGHAVILFNLRLFQRLGHRIVLLIGDFTGMIGDPSGRSDERPPLTREVVEEHMKTYTDQAARIIDLRSAEVERHYNSRWMEELTIRQWVEYLKRVPVSVLLQRNDFRQRLADGHGLSVAEMEYSLFMAYDSVVLQPDVEIGGIDQFLNLHMCRTLMETAGQKPEITIVYDLLPGTTGERDDAGRFKKMSKSAGNYIPVTADPADMYGKVMSIPDDVMLIWFRELTWIRRTQLEELAESIRSGKTHPMDAKKLLARVIVGTFNGRDRNVIAAAEANFNSKFGSAAVLVPPSTEHVAIKDGECLVDTLARITGRSKSDLRRTCDQKGVRILRQEDYDPLATDDLFKDSAEFAGDVFRIGKRAYYKLGG